MGIVSMCSLLRGSGVDEGRNYAVSGLIAMKDTGDCRVETADWVSVTHGAHETGGAGRRYAGRSLLPGFPADVL
jgi:hypothetical protein